MGCVFYFIWIHGNLYCNDILKTFCFVFSTKCDMLSQKTSQFKTKFIGRKSRFKEFYLNYQNTAYNDSTIQIFSKCYIQFHVTLQLAFIFQTKLTENFSKENTFTEGCLVSGWVRTRYKVFHIYNNFTSLDCFPFSIRLAHALCITEEEQLNNFSSICTFLTGNLQALKFNLIIYTQYRFRIVTYKFCFILFLLKRIIKTIFLKTFIKESKAISFN